MTPDIDRSNSHGEQLVGDGASPPPPTVSRVRRVGRTLLVNGGLVVASLVVAVLLAEVAVRILAPQQLIMIRPDLWQPADTVGWLHRPNVRTRINTGERTVDVYTDSDGFRVGSEGIPADGVPVLLLGDSFFEALQVDYERSFAGLLQAKLPAAAGMPVRVRNAGMASWDPNQYLLRARALFRHTDYRLVITGVFMGNDIVPRRVDYFRPRTHVERHHLRLPHSLKGRELTNAILLPINDFLEVRSHLFILVRNRLQTLRMRLGLAPTYFPPQFLESAEDSPEWEVTADICREIDDLATAHGARALFVLIPTPFQVDSASFTQYVRGFGLDTNAVDLELPNRMLDREFAQRGLATIDLLPDLRKAHDKRERLYGSVDPHFTPLGNELMAESVTPVAARLLSESR